METASLLVQNVSGASIDVIDSILPSETILEFLVSPLKFTKKSSVLKKYKRTLSEVITEILYVNDVKFNSLQVSYCPS